jgi:hypothetical protein
VLFCGLDARPDQACGDMVGCDRRHSISTTETCACICDAVTVIDAGPERGFQCLRRKHTRRVNRKGVDMGTKPSSKQATLTTGLPSALFACAHSALASVGVRLPVLPENVVMNDETGYITDWQRQEVALR